MHDENVASCADFAERRPEPSALETESPGARSDATVPAVAGSLGLHACLCKLARVDADTFMATSVAAVCSPPFVPMLARVLNNPATLFSGMTTGIIGYALGNYLGISLGLLLQRL